MTSPVSVLWTMQLPSGDTACAIMVSKDAGARLLWLFNGELEGSDEFQNRGDAIQRAEELRLLMRISGRN